MKNAFFIGGWLVLLLCGLTACEKLLPPETPSGETLAGPIEGLTPEQLALHLRGDAEFAKNFGAAEGLGPVFVQSACQNCHASDGKGNPFNNLTRFGKYAADGVTWDPMLSLGGPQLQHRAVSGYVPETIPVGALSSRFIAPNVSGSGLLEAVEDAVILSMADSNDANGDGISGRPQLVAPPSYFLASPWQAPLNGLYIGRFGRKASSIDLLMQTVSAYKQDMGITSPYDPLDPLNYTVSALGGDPVADPEISASVVDAVAFYIRTLKPPPRRNSDDPEVRQGEAIFLQTGCESCHKQSLTTGNSPVEALRFKTFSPYTDLLLHDMGAELDDRYTESQATTSEWRTTPLWGLGLQENSQGGRYFLLHDGRARTFDEAVQYHGGEAASSRANYRLLSGIEKDKLVKFLLSL